MKTDLEKFKKLYDDLNIKYLEVHDTIHDKVEIYLGDYYHRSGISNPSELIDGYPGFYTVIEFDTSGKFLKQGFWE